MPAPNHDVLRTMRAGSVVVAFAIASGSAMAVAARLAEPPLHVGDIVRFRHLQDDASVPGRRLMVNRANQFGCVLDLGVMRGTGGSLVVEGLDPEGDRRYRLHWAGPRTSNDGADCGSDAELMVNARDLRTIALAAEQVRSEEPAVLLPPD